MFDAFPLERRGMLAALLPLQVTRQEDVPGVMCWVWTGTAGMRIRPHRTTEIERMVSSAAAQRWYCWREKETDGVRGWEWQGEDRGDETCQGLSWPLLRQGAGSVGWISGWLALFMRMLLAVSCQADGDLHYRLSSEQWESKQNDRFTPPH